MANNDVRAAATVRTLIDGQLADPIIQAETERRAWWLLKGSDADGG